MMGRMFGRITATWNPITGCLHSCRYCWARRYAARLARFGIEPYASRGFKPSLVTERLKRPFRKGDLVFVSDMGDMWGEWTPPDWIRLVLEEVRSSPAAFLFLSKNPRRYHEFARGLENAILAATIESNLDYNLSLAPSVRERYEAMRSLDHPCKAVVLEPILDFDDGLVLWLREIGPLRSP
jgi:protein gp37